MSAGLPGIGLGGVFFIISALLAPFGELIRTARGRSSRARWRSVGRQLVIALTMILVVAAALGLIGVVAGRGLLSGLASFSLFPLAATTALLVIVLVTAKAADLCARGSRRRARPVATARSSRSAQPKAVERGGTVREGPPRASGEARGARHGRGSGASSLERAHGFPAAARRARAAMKRPSPSLEGPAPRASPERIRRLISLPMTRLQ